MQERQDNIKWIKLHSQKDRFGCDMWKLHYSFQNKSIILKYGYAIINIEPLSLMSIRRVIKSRWNARKLNESQTETYSYSTWNDIYTKSYTDSISQIKYNIKNNIKEPMKFYDNDKSYWHCLVIWDGINVNIEGLSIERQFVKRLLKHNKVI